MKAFKKAKDLIWHQTTVPASINESKFWVPRVYTEPYFYGRITREEAETILTNNGMKDGLYLLRESIAHMDNFSLSMASQGKLIHYYIEKRIDGKYAIGQTEAFDDPVSLIDHYKSLNTGILRELKIPCSRKLNQEAIAFHGLSYKDLHAHMKSLAGDMNANLCEALGQTRESLKIHVLSRMHTRMPWYHGEITREECIRRLEVSGYQNGKFLLRKRHDQTFALSVTNERRMHHYLILLNDGETYSLENGPTFKALIILVDHYHSKRDGLPTPLTVPCAPPDFRLKDWENYLSLRRNLFSVTGAVASPASDNFPSVSTVHKTSDRPATAHLSERLPSTSSQASPSWDRPVSLASTDDEEYHINSTPRNHPSTEDAEKLEALYINIRECVMSEDLCPTQILIEGHLGSGQFAEVKRGVCWIDDKYIPVAVKTLKNSNPSTEKDFWKEANLLKKLSHKHIIRMIGICKNRNLMLVMELADLGPLKGYLEKHLNMKMWHQIEIMLQICEGMGYLESMSIVHRDLAARNVLLMTDHFAKITDFGLSRMIEADSDYYISYQPGKWPIKWCAPECIDNFKFDSRSDVWSFGITMWEIMSFGDKPYKDIKNSYLIKHIKDGKRLQKPRGCSDSIYCLMLKCWELSREERISFTELMIELQTLFQQERHKSK